MSVFNGSDPSTMPTRELRRLGHSMVVATSYVNRGTDGESTETALATAVRQGYDSGYAEGLVRAAADNARIEGRGGPARSDSPRSTFACRERHARGGPAPARRTAGRRSTNSPSRC